ncbi:hypothetical protein ABPG75_010043 [Micractinium tetrahymenae]
MPRPRGTGLVAGVLALLAFSCCSATLCDGLRSPSRGGRRLASQAARAGPAVLAAAALPLRPPLPLRRQPLRPLPPPSRPRWVQLWADEFNGDALDGSKWEALEGDGSAFGIPGWGNNELQVYTGRRVNVRVQSGSLVITAQAEHAGSPYGRYTSARLRTSGRFAVAPSATYPRVRIEARIKLSAGDGMWPAFWMLPEDWAYGNWPASGEIDILEARNGMDYVLGSAHSGGVGALHTINGGTPGMLADGWHVYTLEWEAKQLRWYLDGVQYLAVRSANGTQAQNGWYSLGGGPDNPDAPFDKPFHLLLNLAVGGNFPWVSPDVVAATLAAGPKRMWVDWVRVSGRTP